MSLKWPKTNIFDRLLKFIGKKRAVFLPKVDKDVGPFYQISGWKEKYWKALRRKKIVHCQKIASIFMELKN